MNEPKGNELDRRDLLRLLSVGALATTVAAHETSPCSQHQDAEPTQTTAYVLQFFSKRELDLMGELMERILPADDHSPGAKAAGVPLFADRMLSTGDERDRTDWRAGLAVIERELAVKSVDAWIAEVAANELDPQSPGELFFVALKRMTVDGYYTSEIGIHQDLDYRGNTYVQHFKGCTHPEHFRQSP